MQTFVSWIRLEREREESYSLFGTVVLPCNGLRIVGMEFQTPRGVAIPRSFFPVQIQLGKVEQMPDEGWLHVETPLDFQATGMAALPVGGRTGFTHVIAFSVVDGALVGRSFARVPEPSSESYPELETPSPCQCSGWTAWRYVNAPAPQSLHVHGYFTADSLGYVGKLGIAVPQGIDPDELVLRLDFRTAQDVHPIVRAKIPVMYMDPKPVHRYRRVLVLYPSQARCQFSVLELA